MLPSIINLLWAFLAGLITTIIATPWVKNTARSLKLYDKPSNRKVHKRPTTRLGGIAIWLGIMVAFLPYFDRLSPPILGILLGSTILLLVGAIDDIISIPPIAKLGAQCLAAFIAIPFGVQIEFITNPLNGSLLFFSSLSIPLTIFWIVGIINTINFIDGTDGLAAGLGAISAATLTIVALKTSQFPAAMVTIALFGTCLGFLKYNFAPAKLFMGDSGSMVIGYLLSTASILGALKSTATLSIAVPLLILGIPISDAILAIARRVKNKKSPFSPDRDHLHHKLLNRGYSSRKVAIVMYIVSGLLGSLAIAISLSQDWVAYSLLGGVSVSLIAATFVFQLKKRKSKN